MKTVYMELIIDVKHYMEAGNSELLADKVLENIAHTKRYLTDYHIKPIDDKRHESGGCGTPFLLSISRFDGKFEVRPYTAKKGLP
ncbi:hypothetical protein RCG24_11330 [Neobacillus sp. OS1-32]|uniref:hypothetical protein n=1 Tax=Neobacillus sp. OS1-32 TaxID=3070682 RepID=UPI0027DFA95A|nr:hypothetical protein [Neobacillus sp. OS1-32]WML28642.1 hypothetical protein RCG24_11330 [Neobacillus sp. OS1-32]